MQPEADRSKQLQGRLIDRKYRLIEQLGSGGMAAVWLARNERIEREVAIKLLLPEVMRSPETLQRFRDEARAAGRIGNPHICEILDLGDSPQGPYIVMERLRGEDLAQLLMRDIRMPPTRAVAVVREALEGLAAAHAAGIVHRDLKPANIFLHEPRPGKMLVKLMDFGVSKFRDRDGRELTQNTVLGTPEYMAPEQVRGASSVDHRADIWSVGAILYRAIAGRHVFTGNTIEAIIVAILRDTPTPIEDYAPDMDAGLADVIMRCLERDLDKRVGSAEELSELLAPYDERILAGRKAPPRVPTLTTAPLDAVGTGPQAAVPQTADDPDQTAPVSVHQSLAGGPPATAAAEPQSTRSEDSAQITMVHAQSAERQRRRSGLIPLLVGVGLAVVGAGVYSLVQGDGGNAPEDPLAAQPGDKGDASGSNKQAAEPSDKTDPEASENAGDTPEDAKADAATPKPAGGDPAGTVRVGKFLGLVDTGRVTDHKGALEVCAQLDRDAHLGKTGWRMANPTELGKFASAEGTRKGAYWSRALWRGKAIMIVFPSGKKLSRKASRKAYPFCIVKDEG